MGTRTTEVLIDIEDQKGQLYHRLKVNGMTVLVDGTPEDDPAIGQTIDWILAAPVLLAACKAMLEWDRLEKTAIPYDGPGGVANWNARLAKCQEAFDLALAALAKAEGE